MFSPQLLQIVAQSLPNASSGSVRDFLQYISQAAAVGAFIFAWRTNGRVTRMETMLTEPENGIAKRVAGTSKQTHEHATMLQGHEVRIENHGREIDRLDRDKEPRRTMGPRDVGMPDRRSSV